MAADFRARELLEGADEQKRHELMQARGPVGPPRKRWLPFLWISLPFDFKDSLFCILLSLLVGVAVIYRHIFFENPEKKDQKHIIIPMSHRNTDIFGRHGFLRLISHSLPWPLPWPCELAAAGRSYVGVRDGTGVGSAGYGALKR